MEIILAGSEGFWIDILPTVHLQPADGGIEEFVIGLIILFPVAVCISPGYVRHFRYENVKTVWRKKLSI